MKIIEKNEGKKINYNLTGTKLDFADGALTLDLARYQQDDTVTRDIMVDSEGYLTTGRGLYYAAQVEIPARKYTETVTTAQETDAQAENGNPVDVVLGYDTAADYELNTDSMGAAVGRFANRIAGAQFPLYEEIVHITPNQNGNCLHSGLHGFNHTMFDVALTPGETDSVTMTAS